MDPAAPTVDGSCPALSRAVVATGRCTVHPVRPMVCRLWGAAASMPCPHGCVPAGGLLDDGAAMGMLAAGLDAGGHRDVGLGDLLATCMADQEAAPLMGAGIAASSPPHRTPAAAAGPAVVICHRRWPRQQVPAGRRGRAIGHARAGASVTGTARSLRVGAVRLVDAQERTAVRLHPGEVEAIGWRVETLTDLVERLREASPGVAGRPRVVAVDGRGAAGKTVLVQRLRAVVPASAVVHTDDVAWNQASFDWGRVISDGVLEPLHRGQAVDFSPPAWAPNGRGGSIRVPAGPDVVWVEGTGIIRSELAGWIDASLYVQADLDAQLARLVDRDGDEPAVREHRAEWLEEELPFMAREQPWAKATLVVAGASDLPHDPDAEIVVAPPARA